MAWKVELDLAAVHDLGKADLQDAWLIQACLYGRVAPLDNPRRIGEALKSSRLGKFGGYRIADYRVVTRSRTTLCECWWRGSVAASRCNVGKEAMKCNRDRGLASTSPPG